MRLMGTTIYDVAAMAGVSINTASRIINGQTKGKRRDAAERGERVWRAVEALNYRPSKAARSMAMNRGSFI